MRRIVDVGLRLIKHHEGLRLSSYRCPAGVWTIGYGSTGPHVGPNMEITEAKAEALLRADLAWAEDAVSGAIGYAPANDNQFAAMVSLCFNIGAGAFRSSTVLRRHKGGDTQVAADAFLMWDKAHVNGVLTVLPGLVRRRNDERDLYLSAVSMMPSAAPEAIDLGIRGAIEDLQSRLVATGHYAGEVDGIPGPLTFEALRRWRAAQR